MKDLLRPQLMEVLPTREDLFAGTSLLVWRTRGAVIRAMNTNRKQAGLAVFNSIDLEKCTTTGERLVELATSNLITISDVETLLSRSDNDHMNAEIAALTKKKFGNVALYRKLVGSCVGDPSRVHMPRQREAPASPTPDAGIIL